MTLGMDGVGPGWVTVRWDQSGARGAYRVGAFGKFDLFVVEADGAAAQQEVQGAGGVSPQVSSDADQELMIEISAATAAAYSRASSAAVSAASSHMSAPSEPLQPVPHPDGGHDEQWLDVAEANSMQCPICMCVARDALAHDCGNLFCDLCWTRWIAENPSCPVCREDGQGIVRAPRDQRKILNLMIRCPLGCDETFRLGDKETHVARCPKRPVRCSQCGGEFLAEIIAVHQQDECPARLVPCDLCGEQVPLDQLEAHLLSNLGSHMLALLNESQALKKENQSLKKENQSLHQKSQALEFRVDELQKQVKQVAEIQAVPDSESLSQIHCENC